MVDKAFILNCLQEVKDPEIPPLSIVDLGIVTHIDINALNEVEITLTPTFAGCPALKLMEQMVKLRLVTEPSIKNISVKTSFEKPWNSNMISEKGREALLAHGLAPPVKHMGCVDIESISHTHCPFCNSTNTELKTPFGPTLCRAMHYCNDCLQAFESFKPVS